MEDVYLHLTGCGIGKMIYLLFLSCYGYELRKRDRERPRERQRKTEILPYSCWWCLQFVEHMSPRLSRLTFRTADSGYAYSLHQPQFFLFEFSSLWVGEAKAYFFHVSSIHRFIHQSLHLFLLGKSLVVL